MTLSYCSDLASLWRGVTRRKIIEIDVLPFEKIGFVDDKLCKKGSTSVFVISA